MKEADYNIVIIEVVLVSLLSLIGVHIVLETKLFIGIINKIIFLTELRLPPVFSTLTKYVFSIYFMEILFLIFVIIGYLSVIKDVYKTKFTYLMLILLLPSILSYSYINWPMILNDVFKLPKNLFSTSLTYFDTFVYLLIIVTSQIIFYFLSTLEKIRRTFIYREGDKDEINSVTKYELSVIFLILLTISTVPLYFLFPSGIFYHILAMAVEKEYELYTLSTIMSIIILFMIHYYFKILALYKKE